MISDILKWGTKRADAPAEASVRSDAPVVPSKGLPKFIAALSQHDSPLLLDFGPASGSGASCPSKTC
jgi:hypothetical protein